MSLIDDAQHFRTLAARCRAESLQHKLLALAAALDELARVQAASHAATSPGTAANRIERDSMAV